MKYFTFVDKDTPQLIRYYCLLWIILSTTNISIAQNQFDLRFQFNTIDCEQSTACFNVQIRSANGQIWGLAGQNYRIYYDGNLASFQTGISQLDNAYAAFNLRQDEQNLTATTTSNVLDFENNLSFLNYHIDLNDLELGGINLSSDSTWLTTSQLCFDVDESLINDPNTCLEAIWAKDDLTQEYATSFVEVAEWVGNCETRPAIGANFDNLEAGDGNASCFNLNCQPVVDNATYDIRLESGDLDCETNTICYAVQLRNPTGNIFNLAGQNYRLFYDGSVASWQSGSSFLDDKYQDFTVIENFQNQPANTASNNLNFENDLSFLNYTMDLNEVMTGGIELPTDGTWFTTSELCFQVTETAINDPNTCLEAVWAREGLTDEYATSFVEIAQWVDMMDTEMTDGAGYDDLNAADGQAACFIDSCTPDTLDLALFKSLADPTTTSINLGGDIAYKIEVVNQGNITVETVTITDNLPDELILSDADTNNWTILSNNIAQNVLQGPLASGDTLAAYIILTVTGGSSGQIIFNTAEIVQVQQMNVNILLDIDSTPNEDDEINEDDEDSAIIELLPFEPMGYIYCEETGELLTDGTIAISGIGQVFFGQDTMGNDLDGSNGQYQFWTDGTPGIYSLTYTHPDGFTISTTNLPFGEILNPDTEDGQNLDQDGTIDGHLTLGSMVANNSLLDTAFINNPYFLNFDLGPESAYIHLNNIPVFCKNTPDCPTIDLADNVTTCEGGSTQLNPVLSNDLDGNFIWSPTTGLDNANSQNPIASPTQTTTYTITFSDGANCETNAAIAVNVGMELLINLTPDTLICANTPFQLTAAGSTSHNWSPAEGLNATNIANPIATISNSITYTVTVSDGICTSTASVTLSIDYENPIFNTIIQDIVIACDETIPTIPTITATDNSGNEPVIQFVENTSAPDVCPAIMTRVWTATDDCGNQNTMIQSITIIDDEAPVFNNVPTDFELTCNENIPLSSAPTATDNCDNSVNIESIETQQGTDCNQQIIRTWTATDNCGNVETTTQIISIQDNEMPVFNNIPMDEIANCNNIPAPINAVAIDDCDTDIDIIFDEQQNGTGCNYQLIRTWTATDNCGNTVVATQNIQVQDNTVPVLADVPADVTISCGSPIATGTSPTATDNCDADVPILASELTIPNACGFTIFRTWSAIDDCGNTSTAEQSVFVSDIGQPIFSSSPADLTISCSETIPNTVVITAQNECNNNPITVAFEENTTSSDCSELITRIWSAMDDCGNVRMVKQIILIVDTDAPTLLNIPINMIVECGENIPNAATPMAMDACDDTVTIDFEEIQTGENCNQQITRTWTATDACGNVKTAEQVISIQDNTPPILTGIPENMIVTCGDIAPPANPIATDNCDTNLDIVFVEVQTGTACDYTLVRTWTATDDCGNSAVETQNIQFQDNSIPTFSSDFPDIAINCNNVGQGNIPFPTVIDGCDNAIQITFEENTINGDCTTGLNKVRTWIATDNCGNVITATQNISIQDDSLPILEGIPADMTLDCNDVPAPVNPVATDNCDTNVAIVFEEVQIGTDCDYTLIRTWTAFDDCGNSVSESQQIFIIDETAPVITPIVPSLANISSGDTLIMQCGMTNIFGDNDAIANDACDANPFIELKEGDILVSTCAEDDFLVWMECYWEATDACGNSSQFWIYIKVVDTTIPEFDYQPMNWTIGCNDPIPPAVMPSISDNCSPVSNIQIIEEENIIDGSCEGTLTLLRTWIAIDECGNSNTVNQTIVVKDNIAPSFSENLEDLIIDETLGETVPEPPLLNATDACDSDVILDFDEITEQEDCERTITRTWLAIDDCGNTTSMSQIILVWEDCIEPPVALAILEAEVEMLKYKNSEFDSTQLAIENRASEEEEGGYDIKTKEEVLVYSGFSPNGDGIHDYFTIRGLNPEIEHQLIIFNRTGQVLFKNNNYKNNWGGQLDEVQIPDGVYYYVLELKNLTRQSGYVQICR
jgi:gliding motility-associated-like protein/uncharacterized repeat protein (TIGR01451 family)